MTPCESYPIRFAWTRCSAISAASSTGAPHVVNTRSVKLLTRAAPNRKFSGIGMSPVGVSLFATAQLGSHDHGLSEQLPTPPHWNKGVERNSDFTGRA